MNNAKNVHWLRIARLTDDMHRLKQEMATEEESQSTWIEDYTGRKMAERFLESVTIDLTAEENDIEENRTLGERTIADIGDT